MNKQIFPAIIYDYEGNPGPELFATLMCKLEKEEIKIILDKTIKISVSDRNDNLIQVQNNHAVNQVYREDPYFVKVILNRQHEFRQHPVFTPNKLIFVYPSVSGPSSSFQQTLNYNYLFNDISKLSTEYFNLPTKNFLYKKCNKTPGRRSPIH